MVVPVGHLDMPPGSMEAPQVVKEYHAIWWYVLVILFTSLCIARFVAMDIFGAFNTGLMALLAWYLVTDNCAKMSQCCVLYFGIICFTNGIFDLLPLLASLGGRTTETTEYGDSPEAGTSTFTVTIEKHPFFDSSKGDFYNYQSCVMIASPLVMFVGAAMASKTYHAFQTSLFADSDDEAANQGLLRGARGGGWPTTGGRQLGGNTFQGYQPARPTATPTSRFEGPGYRLGA